MLGITGGTEVFISTAALVIAAAVLGIARAAMKLFQSRQTKQREASQDLRTFSEFFFGSERNPRTGTPAREGWTSKVDNNLALLTAGQARTEAAVHKILGEVVEDGNGDHNLRGIVKRGAEAAGAEVFEQTQERKRVQNRDAQQDGAQ